MCLSRIVRNRFARILLWSIQGVWLLAVDPSHNPLSIRSGQRVVTHVWTDHQGSPDNWITGIAESPDGTLWFCASGGAARINRFKVERIATVRGLGAHRDLAFDQGGLAWMAGKEGLDWASLGASTAHLGELTGWHSDSSDIRMRPGQDGRFLIRKDQSLSWLRTTEGRIESEPLPEPPHALPSGLAFLARREGAIVLVDSAGTLWRSAGGVWRSVSSAVGPEVQLVEVALAEDREQRIWLSWLSASGRFGLSRFDGHQWQHMPDAASDLHGRVTCFAAAPGGELIAGTDKGFVMPVTEINSSTRAFAVDQDDSIESLLVDVDDVWWVGTRRSGLFRIAASQATLWSLPGRSETRSTLALEDGSFLAATDSHGIVRFFPETMDQEARFERLQASETNATCIVRTKDGIWAATQRALIQYVPTRHPGKWERIVHRQMDSVRLMTTNSVGELVVARADGHIQVRRRAQHGHRWDSLGRAGTGVVHGLASCPETLWAATQTGLFRWVGHCWQPVPETESLGPAMAIAYLPELGGMAVGFKKHLVIRRKVGLTKLELAPEFSSGLIHQITSDIRSNLWLGTSLGLVRITRAAIDRVHTHPSQSLSYEVVSRPAGLPGGRFTSSVSPGPSRLPNGDLIFPTQEGILQVRPDGFQPTKRLPRLQVTTVQADGTALSAGATLASRLEAIQPRVLQLRYDIGTVDPNQPIRCRQRALPSQPHWQLVSEGQELVLHSPPIGLNRIEFELRSSSSDWQPAGAFEFFVKPAWYAGRIAKAAAVCMAATPAAIAWVLLHQRKRRLRRQELADAHHIRRERHRIARDLHDHLGNRLSELQILAEQLQRTKAHPNPGNEIAERIRWRSMEAVGLLGELVHLLEDGAPRPWAGVVELLRDEAAGYLETAGVELRFTADTDGPIVTAETRQQLLAALRELLHNAVRHGHASTVTIHLVQASGFIELEVADNGSGFDIQWALTRGRGLAGLQERALHRNGVLRASSLPGETRIQFAIPPESARPEKAPAAGKPATP